MSAQAVGTEDRDWKVIDEDCTRVEVDGDVLFYVATTEKKALAAKLLGEGQ